MKELAESNTKQIQKNKKSAGQKTSVQPSGSALLTKQKITSHYQKSTYSAIKRQSTASARKQPIQPSLS